MKYLTEIFFYLLFILYIFNLLYNQATIREKAMLIEMLEQMQIFSWKMSFTNKIIHSIYQPACYLNETFAFKNRKQGDLVKSLANL